MVDIANIAPTVTRAEFDAASVSCEANTVTLTVVFTDPGVDTWRATIDWGDGSSVKSVNPATSPFTVIHTHGRAGIYTAKVSVTDERARPPVHLQPGDKVVRGQ